MNVLSAVVCAAALSITSYCQAGVIFGGTRVIYPSDKKEVQLNVSNLDDNTRHLVQAWVSMPDGNKAPFIVTPPLLKLSEKQETLLHIMYTGNAASSSDRETLYTLNIKTVPNVPDALKDKSRLQIAIHSQLKLFLRPSNFSQHDADTAWEKLTFTRTGNTLHAKNPTPFYISFKSLAVSGKEVTAVNKNLQPAAAFMVAPLASQDFVIPAGASGTVSWSVVNDYGGVSETKKQSLSAQ